MNATSAMPREWVSSRRRSGASPKACTITPPTQATRPSEMPAIPSALFTTTSSGRFGGLLLGVALGPLHAVLVLLVVVVVVADQDPVRPVLVTDEMTLEDHRDLRAEELGRLTGVMHLHVLAVEGEHEVDPGRGALDGALHHVALHAE